MITLPEALPDSETALPSRRTRLSSEREREIFGAVVELLREVGYDALTMDAVALRAKSSKATLYRQWDSKPRLVAAALHHGKPVRMDEIDTGSLRGDLYEIARAFGAGAPEDNRLICA